MKATGDMDREEKEGCSRSSFAELHMRPGDLNLEGSGEDNQLAYLVLAQLVCKDCHLVLEAGIMG